MPNSECSSYAREAFHLALRELAQDRPGVMGDTSVKDELVMTIIDLTKDGLQDPKQIARYALARLRQPELVKSMR